MTRRLFVILVAWLLILACAPLFTHANPTQTHPELQNSVPNLDHLLGTDYLGRDVWGRLLYGGQRTLFGATISTLIALIVGSLLGLMSATRIPIVDIILTSTINAILAIPSLLLALIVLTLLGRGNGALFLAVGISQVAPMALFVRSVAQQIAITDYVQVARAIGATERHIMVQHILRGIASPVRAYTMVIFSYVILNSAALSFLGFSDVGVPDWGVMLSEGRNSFRLAPWVAIVPGIALVFTIMLINRLSTQLGQQSRGRD